MGTKKFIDNQKNIVLDKAHIIKEWGGTFHSDYLRIGPLSSLVDTPSWNNTHIVSCPHVSVIFSTASELSPHHTCQLHYTSVLLLCSKCCRAWFLTLHLITLDTSGTGAKHVQTATATFSSHSKIGHKQKWLDHMTKLWQHRQKLSPLAIID